MHNVLELQTREMSTGQGVSPTPSLPHRHNIEGSEPVCQTLLMFTGFQPIFTMPTSDGWMDRQKENLQIQSLDTLSIYQYVTINYLKYILYLCSILENKQKKNLKKKLDF